MGDDNFFRKKEVGADGDLFKVALRPYRMAGFLVTNAQYQCFLKSGRYEDPKYWPGPAGLWKSRAEPDELIPSLFENWERGAFLGLYPVSCNYWQAQAYALWEMEQRCAMGERVFRLDVPTEAQWEGGARWPRACALSEGEVEDADSKRWKFAYTSGEKYSGWYGGYGLDRTRFTDVGPFDFNHMECDVHGKTPVGIFNLSHAWFQGVALCDLAGNVKEWTSSNYSKVLSGDSYLGPGVFKASRARSGYRTVRGGDGTSDVSDCRVSSREGAYVESSYPGFRLVMI